MAFAGMRGTGDFATDERPKDFRNYILWRDPNGQTPIMAIMAKARSEKLADAEFSWYEESLDIVRLLNTVAANTTSTSLGAAAGCLNLVAGDLLLIEKAETATYDNEIVMVSSVTSDTAFVVKRGAANTTAANITTSSNMTRIGNAFGEGTRSPAASSRNPTKVTNKAQIFKTAYEETGTVGRTTNLRTGDSYKNDKKRRAFDHSASIELALMFGVLHEDTDPVSNKPRRFTKGLRSFLSTHTKIWSASPTEDTFLDWIHQVFDYKSGGAGDQRIILAGNGFLNVLNKLARASSSTRVNFDGYVGESYGMKLQRWITPQGEFGVKSHPLMNQHALFKNSAFVLDPSALVWRYMVDTRPEDDIQENDRDGRKGQWFTEAGLEVEHETTMAYTGNFNV